MGEFCINRPGVNNKGQLFSVVCNSGLTCNSTQYINSKIKPKLVNNV